jgi:hypothetical protein
MIKVYALVIVLGVLGIAGYGAKYYYDTTQATIATLRDNNAKLEVAIETSEASIATLQQEAVKNAELTKQLQGKLQVAEAYGDNLRKRLRQLDLVADAINDAEDLEGRMNRATAKLWRDIETDTGGSGDAPLPKWVQPIPTGAGSESGNTSNQSDSSNSSPTKTD